MRNRIPTFLAIIVVTLAGLTWAQDKHEPATDQQREMPKRNMNAGYFGARLEPISEEIQDELKLDSPMGIHLREILKDSPAEQAGLKVHDVVRKVDGNEIEGVEEFVTIMEKSKPGQVMKFTIVREGKEDEIELTLGTRPPNFGQPPVEDKEPATKPN